MAGFTTVILITITLGLFAYAALGNIHSAATNIVSDSLPGVYIIGQIQNAQSQKYALILEYLQYRDKDQADRARVEADIETNTATLSARMDEYEKTIFTSKDRQLFDALKDARVIFLNSVTEVVTASKASQSQEALALFESHLKPAFQKFTDAIQAEVTFNKDNGDENGKAITAAVSSAKSGVLIGLLLASIAASLIALFLTRGIATQLV